MRAESLSPFQSELPVNQPNFAAGADTRYEGTVPELLAMPQLSITPIEAAGTNNTLTPGTTAGNDQAWDVGDSDFA